jgi:hypothetical protein
MLKTIASAKTADFYKTMPSRSVEKAFQDVVYAKFCLHPLSKVVVSFKRK